MNKAEISIGDVLHLYVEEFKKYKFFIILGENDAEFTFASFYINYFDAILKIPLIVC